MVNINTFKGYIDFISNKVQVGNSYTITQFNELCNRAQMQLFEKDFQVFLETEQLSEYLKTFLKNSTFSVPVNGEISYPSDFQHLSSLRKYYINPKGVGRMIQIEEVNNVAWGFIQSSTLQEPTLRFPKYSEFSNVIRFLPRNIGIVEMDYFKTPVAPIWGYTVVSGRPVYSSSTSVNFEWDDFSTNNIAGIFLSLLAVNLKDQELIQFSEMYKSQTNSNK